MTTRRKVKSTKSEVKAPPGLPSASETLRVSLTVALHPQHDAHLESERLSRLRKRPTRF